MSTSDQSAITYDLPKGVQVVGAYETTTSNQAGSIVQGMQFTIQLPGGATTSLFVPYDELHDTALVHEMIAERVAQIQAITH